MQNNEFNQLMEVNKCDFLLIIPYVRLFIYFFLSFGADTAADVDAIEQFNSCISFDTLFH